MLNDLNCWACSEALRIMLYYLLSGEVKMLFSRKGLEQPHRSRTFICRFREAGWLWPSYLPSWVSVFSSIKWESKTFATKEEKTGKREEQREKCLPSDQVVTCLKCHNNLAKDLVHKTCSKIQSFIYSNRRVLKAEDVPGLCQVTWM